MAAWLWTLKVCCPIKFCLFNNIVITFLFVLPILRKCSLPLDYLYFGVSPTLKANLYIVERILYIFICF